MENASPENEFAYKKALKRVKEIRIFYYMLMGFVLVGGVHIFSNLDFKNFKIINPYPLYMVGTWAIFLIGCGIYLFTPYFRNWEEKKIKEIMDQNNKNTDGTKR